MKSMVGRTMGVRVEATYAVFVHTDRTPEPVEWTRAVDELRAVPDPSAVSVLVYSEGGAPTVTQRAEMLRIFRRSPPRVAVLTRSMITRIAAKAMGIFAKELRVFEVHQTEAALAHLGLGERDRATALRHLNELKSELSIARSSQTQP
jgi:hypothetical protein